LILKKILTRQVKAGFVRYAVCGGRPSPLRRSSRPGRPSR
jgi:hypothetical protein